jgi:predicted O-methyltransferase YrrM
MEAELFTEVDNYISSILALEDQSLVDTIVSIDKEGLPHQSVSAIQGRLLQVLMMACNAKNVLELGTLGGYSTIWIARALPENGSVVTVEVNARHAAVAQRNIESAGLSHRVDMRIGSALEIMPVLIEERNEPFDLIFIDADKEPYTEYFDYAVQLARRGTLIICDNVVREGKVLDSNSTDEKVIGVQRLMTALGSNTNVTATVLQTVGAKGYDGMVIAVVN